MLLALLLFFPEAAAGAFSSALRLCLSSVLPTVFPFTAASAVLSGLGFAEWVGEKCGRPFRLLYGISPCGCCALLLARLTGFAGGIIMTSDLYSRGRLTDSEASRLVFLCALPSPAFFLGGIGASMLGSVRRGAILWGICLFSSSLIGIFLRIFFPVSPSFPYPADKEAFPPILPLLSDSVRKATYAGVEICGSVLFFSVFSSLLSSLPFANGSITLLLSGLLELTGGCARICAEMPEELLLPLLAAFCAFSGISIHAQIASLCPRGLRLSGFFPEKLAQTLLAGAISMIFLSVF